MQDTSVNKSGVSGLQWAVGWRNREPQWRGDICWSRQTSLSSITCLVIKTRCHLLFFTLFGNYLQITFVRHIHWDSLHFYSMTKIQRWIHQYQPIINKSSGIRTGALESQNHFFSQSHSAFSLHVSARNKQADMRNEASSYEITPLPRTPSSKN